MSNLYKQFNKYLVVFLGIFLMSLLSICVGWVCANNKERTPKAEDADTVGYWTNHFDSSVPGSGEASDVDITTAAQFAWICQSINSSNENTVYTETTFHIKNDLDFSAYYWVPMGFGSANTAVRAKFVADNVNPNRKTVKFTGIKIDNRGADFPTYSQELNSFGLFGAIDGCNQVGQGFLSGIELVDVSINIDVSKVASDTVNIGSLVGYFAGQQEDTNAGTREAGVINCSATGTINITQSDSSTNKKVNIGGLVGQTGIISGTTKGAGITYLSTSVQTNSVTLNISGATGSTYNVGGLVGANAGTIDCANTLGGNAADNLSTINSNIGNCGAIVGENKVGSCIKNTFSGNQNDTTTPQIIMADDATDTFIAGGIAGINRGEIKNCANFAGIRCYKKVLGGIVGDNYGTIANCKNQAPVYIDGNAIPASGINEDGENLLLTNEPIMGGIAGNNRAGQISECVNYSPIGGQNNVPYIGGTTGGIAGYNYSNAIITNCVNMEAVGEQMYAESSGGIAGVNSGTITADTTLSSVNKFTANFGTIYANGAAGGISGDWNKGGAGGLPTISISNCYNVGKVCGKFVTTSLGGIVGSIQNSATDSTITNCINLGDIGAVDTAGTVGGIVANVVSKVVIQNCANYASLSAAGTIGGIIGFMGTAADVPELKFTLAAGAILPKDDTTSIGGIIGKIRDSNATMDLTQSVFDLGVMGYGLPSNLIGYKVNKLYPLKLVGSGGSQSNFSIKNSPITYYLTAPGVDDSSAADYYTRGFRTGSDWYFPTANEAARTYYYPVPIIFETNGIFTTDSSATSDTSAVRKYPSQQLSLVTITNDLPIEWDTTTETEVTQAYYVNIYSGLIPDAAQASVLRGDGQYIITGQKIAKPTASTTAYYRKDYEDASSFDTVVNTLGWDGMYNIHQGYQPSFKVNSLNGEDYSFSNKVEDATLNVIICWTPKTFQVQLYEFNYELATYTLINETRSITYSMKPGSTQRIDLLTREGRTCWGWRLTDDLYYSDYGEDEDAWIEAWSENATLDFDNNQWYDDGLKIYCMFTAQKIQLRLSAGAVNGVDGVYDGNVTTQTLSIKFGVPVSLPIPTISVQNYAFRGYYDLDGNLCNAAGEEYVYTGSQTSIELIAQWTYTIKYIVYATINNGSEVELKRVQTTYNQTIPLADRANEQNLRAWGIDYSKVDSALDPNGYKFAGVYSDKDYVNVFDYESVILDDMTIYIKWTINSFRLVLSANIGYDPNNNLREGGWGDGSNRITLTVPYHENLTTYLQNWKQNNPETSTLTMTGFSPSLLGRGYNWAITAIPMGDDYTSDMLLSGNPDLNYMPANDNLILYIVWERMTASLTFNTNGGYFADTGELTKTFPVFFEANIANKINDIKAQLTTPLKESWAFKYWSLTPDGGPISATALMPMQCTLYAIYGEQRKVKFYVIGAYPENVIGEVTVFDGATLGDDINGMGDIIQKMQAMLTDDTGQSAFELDYWVEMTYDMAYNITEANEPFDFDTRVINSDINLLAKLKPNENYIPPNKDTTNYIIIAGIIIVVSLVLLFVVLLARPSREKLTADKQSKDKEIQAQLDEIKELERRRKNMDNPYD